MRAHEFIVERFNDTGWLIKSIREIVNQKSLKNFNVSQYYNDILSYVISQKEFLKLAENIKIVPKIKVVDGYDDNHYIVQGGIKSNDYKNIIDKFRWNNKVYYLTFTLHVTSHIPTNKNLLISDLDSVVGHEIEHIIQRIHRIKDNYHTPGNLKKIYYKYMFKKDPEVDYENTINYVNVGLPLSLELKYYLRHGELISHAYTIGSYIYSDHGNNSLKYISALYNLGWKNRLQNFQTSYKTKYFLNKYSKLFKECQYYNLVSDGKKLWKKLFKEIYRVVNNKMGHI